MENYLILENYVTIVTGVDVYSVRFGIPKLNFDITSWFTLLYSESRSRQNSSIKRSKKIKKSIKYSVPTVYCLATQMQIRRK